MEYKCCVMHCIKIISLRGFIYTVGHISLGVGNMSVWMETNQLQLYGEGRPVGVDILFGLSVCECGKRGRTAVSGKMTEQKRIKRLISYMQICYVLYALLSVQFLVINNLTTYL